MARCIRKPDLFQCWQVRCGEPRPEWMDAVDPELWQNDNYIGWWFVKEYDEINLYSPGQFVMLFWDLS